MNMNSSNCCSCRGGCCTPSQEKKQIVIDFLYLDLSVCGRCQGTERNLDEAVNEVSKVLGVAGFEVVVNKINITSKELAVEHEFISSPTIRINGKDIQLEARESLCEDCGDLCDEAVDCRVWVYEDIEYTQSPKALIINAILKEVYGGGETSPGKKEEYRLPHNLKVFFDGLNNGREK